MFVQSTTHARCSLILTCPLAQTGVPKLKIDFHGSKKYDKSYWGKTCKKIPRNAIDIVVRMGSVTDYFRPRADEEMKDPQERFCRMLTSRDYHMWSSDGMKWLTPQYHDNDEVLGGSANFYPKVDIPGDFRTSLSSWGSSDGSAGGCCANDIRDSSVNEGLGFTMFVRTGALLSHANQYQ